MVHVPLMFPSEWRELLWRLHLQEKKNFLTAHVSMLLKSSASPDMFPFSSCNKKWFAIRHMNRTLFPTTLSIPSYGIGKHIGLTTYRYPLVCVFYVKKDKSNMCYMYVTWGSTKVVCVCYMGKDKKIQGRDEVYQFVICSKKGWFVANFTRFTSIYEIFFVFPDGLKRVYDSSWIDVDLISRGKFWKIDHQVVTMQRPDEIIVLPRIWSPPLITKLNVKTPA